MIFMEKEILCKTKWYQVGYQTRSAEGKREASGTDSGFQFQRIYSPREIAKEEFELSSLGLIATLISCEPYNHDSKDCEFCEYRECRGKVNLFEYDKDF